MNFSQHPELLDQLASAYALGTLRGGARRRFETLAREQAPVRAAALIWQSRVASMNELQVPSRAPGGRVDTHRQPGARRPRAGRHGRQPARPPPSPRPRAGCAAWRCGAAPRPPARWPRCWPWSRPWACRTTSAARSASCRPSSPPCRRWNTWPCSTTTRPARPCWSPSTPTTSGSRCSAWVTSRSRPTNRCSSGPCRPQAGPRSLGVLSQERLLKLAAAEGDVREVPTLAISLEPKGGVPSETGPTGPVLFKGALIQKML